MGPFSIPYAFLRDLCDFAVNQNSQGFDASALMGIERVTHDFHSRIKPLKARNNPMRIPIRLLAIPTLLFICPHTRAENKVLFIGNSFTFGQGGTTSVAEIFDRLAIAGGQDDPSTEMRAVGGQSYRFHENDATSREAIESKPWTHVIIQNYSTEPTHIGNPENHINSGTLLYKRIIENNPSTNVILYQTWSRAAKNPMINGTSTDTTFSTTAEMQSEIRAGYLNLRDSLNAAHPGNPPVVIAPVGDAWQNAGGFLAESHTDFADLHAGDDYHGNDNGYFLSAAVYYAKIYGKSPVGLHTHSAVTSLNLNLTENATSLEQIAWDTVSGKAAMQYSMHPSPLTVSAGAPAVFTTSARGSRPFAVQWFRNGNAIPNATELTLTLPSAGEKMDGSIFTVTVSNAVSSLTSSPATLSIADGDGSSAAAQ